MRTLLVLTKKEGIQIMRDPSTMIIAFVLPIFLLFIFGFGINLDSSKMRIGLVLQSESGDANSLASAFHSSPFLDVVQSHHTRDFSEQLVSGQIRGMVVVPPDFSLEGLLSGGVGGIQIIADGSEPNIASFVQNYARGVILSWVGMSAAEQGYLSAGSSATLITSEARFWYNPELKSRNFLLPGSMVIILTLVGTLLTALVIAREWERGTMEALLSMPVTTTQTLLSKLVAYFILAMGSMIVCWLAIVLLFHVPFRGSFFALFLSSAVFLFGALGQGLLISTLAKDQFIASQAALMSGFLPSFMLSGFIFEISSMPQVIQWFTLILPARHYVTSLQTLFLVGDVWGLLLPSMLYMGVIGVLFFAITLKKMTRRLDA